MSFAAVLSGYIQKYGIKASDLAEASGVSGSTISRLRNGKRVPSSADGTVQQICCGLEKLTDGAVSQQEAFEALSAHVDHDTVDRARLVHNLNVLIDTLDLSAAGIARACGYDPSHLSKIRSGARNPGKGDELCESTATYVANQVTERNAATLASLLGCETGEVLDPATCKVALLSWLASEPARREDPVEHFLAELDQFDLNEYLHEVRFDQVKVPTVPFQLPRARDFYGIPQFQEAELAWCRATATSKATDPVFMYSDMPLEEEARDPEFVKGWMLGVAMILKRGLRVNIVHDLDRPLSEMMLGLEGWIPLYMTGQVSPYYFKRYKPGVFNRILRVSGAAALSGESVAGDHAGGRYHLTNTKDELAFFQRYAQSLLDKAAPLMQIFSASQEEAYRQCLRGMLGDDHVLQTLEPAQRVFRNITIEAIQDRCVIITKTNEPVMHFVVRHPRLMHAIQNLTVPTLG